MDTQTQIQTIIVDFAYDEITNKVTPEHAHFYCMLSFITHNDSDLATF